MNIILSLLLLGIGAWAFAHLRLRGADHSIYDSTVGAHSRSSAPPSSGHQRVVERLDGLRTTTHHRAGKSLLARGRDTLDAIGAAADTSGVTIKPEGAGPVAGEWVQAEGSDPTRRLLYIHGGAFMLGSPLSHRPITIKLAQLLGASIFAVDYRLMPEHKRLDGIHDCQQAYRWIIDHGPDGQHGEVRKLCVAGDSAGGNLALSTIAWARDQGLRAADAALAICPMTDATFGSPTWHNNAATDIMLGANFGRLHRIPRWLLLYAGWLTNRIKPCDPLISPLLGDLHGLPPTLIHASEAEMLLGDARRYANKATSAGSIAELATWPHMVHVWHVFQPDLPEADAAFAHIKEFLDPYLR